MAQEINIFKNRIVRKGIFDTKAIYKGAKDWFSASADNYDYHEFEKTTKANKPAKGVEIIYKGMGEREVTAYFAFIIKFEILFEKIKKVEVEGKVLDAGEAEMRIEAILVINRSDKWEESKFSRALHKIYKDYIIKEKIESVYGGKSYVEGMAFFQHMKEVFKLHTF